MTSFVKLPDAILYDATLSYGARITYAAIAKRAWRAGRREETDAVQLPTFSVLATDVGASRTAFKGYIKELRDAQLIVTVRPHRAQPSVYYLFDSRPTAADVARVGRIPTFDADVEGRYSDPRRVAQATLDGDVTFISKEVDTREKTSTTAIAVVGDMADLEAPAPVMIDGRNVPLDILCEVCGIDLASPKVRAAATSLGDQKKPKIPGIRSLFWIECKRAVAADPILTGRLLGLVHEPEHFEHSLADRIRVKAEKIAASYPHLPITPHVIRDYWLDVELQPAAPGRPTSDVIRDAFRDAEARHGR